MKEKELKIGRRVRRKASKRKPRKLGLENGSREFSEG